MDWVSDLVIMAEAVVKTAEEGAADGPRCRHCGRPMPVAAMPLRAPGEGHGPKCPVAIAERVLAQAAEAKRQAVRLPLD